MNVGICLAFGVAPLLLPITNNPVSISGSASTRGIAATIGSNNQFFSLLPTFNANNTNIVLADTCDNPLTNYSCIAEHGGIYTPTDAALKTNNLASWNGTPGSDVEADSSANQRILFFNDEMQIAGNDLLGLPFYSDESLSDGYVSPSGISLGVNSSFTQALLDMGAIPTSQWSIWPGNRYQNLDGLLIFGGYDQARVGSDFVAVDPNQDMIIGLEWQHADNTTTNLMPNDVTELSFTFETANDYLLLPTESSTLFRKTLDGTLMDDGSENDFAYDAIPPGQLVVTLSNGNKTLIPATDLFQNPQWYNDEGSMTITNSSIFMDKIVSDADNASMSVLLGEPFLTQYVLVVDFANDAYYLADAVQKDLGTGAQDLQYLCTDDSEAEAQRHRKKKIAAIAGGVVGGVVALAIIAALAFVLRQRRQKQVARSKSGATDPTSSTNVHNSPEVIASESSIHNSPTSPSEKIVVEGIHEAHANSTHEMIGDVRHKTKGGPFEMLSENRD